jgi:hypothetical protein
MKANLIILAAPASVAFLLIAIHSYRVRGKKATLLFFPAILAFGFLRGNLVNIITKGRLPYRFEGTPVIQIGHTGIVEAMGWALALYISWCIAERILAGRNGREKNVFVVMLATCGLMLGFCIMMEGAAAAMDWWNWRPPGGRRVSPVFRDIERGIPAWYSIGFDFFLAWLLLANSKLKNRWYALPALLIFPFHFGMHAIRQFRLDEHLVKVNHIAHLVMFVGSVTLALLCRVEMKRVPDFKSPVPGGSMWPKRFDLAALAIIILTVVLGLIFYAGQGELALCAIPLAAAGLYGWWWSEKGSS